jgi:hypothetical protein
VQYYIGGSVASMAHGEYRQTADADIVADLKLEHVQRLTQLLSTGFYADDEMMRDAITHRTSFNVLHLTAFFKVDFFPLRGRPYDLEAMARRQRETIEVEPPLDAYISSPEDILLAKLEWFRAGGEASDRQWRDVLGIIKLQLFDLDFAYLQHWSQELNIADLLEKAFEDAGINHESRGNEEITDGNSD